MEDFHILAGLIYFVGFVLLWLFGAHIGGFAMFLGSFYVGIAVGDLFGGLAGLIAGIVAFAFACYSIGVPAEQ